MKIKATLSIGFTNAKHEEILDIPDGVLETEYFDWVQEWANNYIELGWEVMEK